MTSQLAGHLHGTARPTVLPVPPDVTAPGVCGGAAPGRVEASRRGAGRVGHPAVDEREPAGRRAGRGGGGRGRGGGGGAVVLTVAPVPSEMVGQGVSGRTAPGPGETSRCGAGGVRHSLVDEGEHTGGLLHSSSGVRVAGGGRGGVPWRDHACRRARHSCR